MAVEDFNFLKARGVGCQLRLVLNVTGKVNSLTFPVSFWAASLPEENFLRPTVRS
jgi:hypothetical protein